MEHSVAVRCDGQVSLPLKGEVDGGWRERDSVAVTPPLPCSAPPAPSFSLPPPLSLCIPAALPTWSCCLCFYLSAPAELLRLSQVTVAGCARGMPLRGSTCLRAEQRNPNPACIFPVKPSFPGPFHSDGKRLIYFKCPDRIVPNRILPY